MGLSPVRCQEMTSPVPVAECEVLKGEGDNRWSGAALLSCPTGTEANNVLAGTACALDRTSLWDWRHSAGSSGSLDFACRSLQPLCSLHLSDLLSKVTF